MFQVRKSILIPRGWRTVFLLLLCMFSGCGVESTGQESLSFSQTFLGRLFSPDGQPIANMTVEIPVTQSVGTSDENGIVEMSSAPVDGDLEVVLRHESSTLSVMLHEVDGEAQIIAYEIKVDLQAQEATLVSSSYDPGTENPTPGAGGNDAGNLDAPATDGGTGDTPVPADTPADQSSSSGNNAVKKGKQVFQSSCGICHAVGQGDGYSTSKLKKVLKQPQHSGVNLSSSKLSDLVAFLNR